MTTTTVLGVLPRRFIIKDVIIADPNPLADLDEVLELLSHDHPALRHTKIFDSDARISSDRLFVEYRIVFPPVKTDG